MSDAPHLNELSAETRANLAKQNPHLADQIKDSPSHTGADNPKPKAKPVTTHVHKTSTIKHKSAPHPISINPSSAQDIVLLECVGIAAVTILGSLGHGGVVPKAPQLAATGLLAAGLMVVARVNGKAGIMLGGIALAGAAFSATKNGKSLGEAAFSQVSKLGKGAPPSPGQTAQQAYDAIGSSAADVATSVVAGVNNPALAGASLTGIGGKAVAAGMTQLGVAYSFGGGTVTGPSTGIAQGASTVGFDCSALMRYAWAKAGVALPRSTYDQIHFGTAVPSLSQAKPGDLLFPSTEHVQMYIGGGQVLESPHTGSQVKISPVSSSYIAIRRP